ncbi:hypothetical protein CAOG_009648 [Capsaspora owczarzaki ATCC 30864]|uniref:Uncharacterized protein n=1 Tax=Capsaspora owczarzaki (strain ATCC 30864) TaxID=595528 RepID=A0A0D2WMU2_CAPO3|nr:hypothetical protein CAOG_009648 [Capsaspora owczarzaki ATCC 30864]
MMMMRMMPRVAQRRTKSESTRQSPATTPRPTALAAGADSVHPSEPQLPDSDGRLQHGWPPPRPGSMSSGPRDDSAGARDGAPALRLPAHAARPAGRHSVGRGRRIDLPSASHCVVIGPPVVVVGTVQQQQQQQQQRPAATAWAKGDSPQQSSCPSSLLLLFVLQMLLLPRGHSAAGAAAAGLRGRASVRP